MKAVLRLAGWTAAIVVVLIVIGFVTMTRADIAYATLQAQYGDASDRYLDMPNGTHVHYRDQGNASGEALVLVHGFGASLFDWSPWVARLGGKYRIISLDLPGHGLTETPKSLHPHMDDLVATIDAVTTRAGVKHFVLVGNSMGGGVAWNYALQHADKLDGLVLEDSVPPPYPPGHELKGKSNVIIFNLMRQPLFQGLLTHIDLAPLIRQGLESALVDKSLVTPALVRRYSDFSRAPGHRRTLLELQNGPHPDAATVNAALGQLKVPTLVMHGKVDALIWRGEGERTAKTIPGSTLILYDGVGHVPMEQIPDKSAADLDGWIQAKALVRK